MKILIITTCFSPENAVGSIRLTKFVKYLVRTGVDVTVISPTLHEGSSIDNSLEVDELKKVTRVKINQSKIFIKLFLRKRNALLKKNSANYYIQKQVNGNFLINLKTKIFRYVQFIYSLIRNLNWSMEVIRYCKNKYTNDYFDSVFTSYPSLGSPWAGISVKKLGISKSLICDFRDPINYENNTTSIIYYLNSLIQKRIIKHSNSVTFVSNGVGEMIDAQSSLDKFKLLSNGFDPDDANIAPSSTALINDKEQLILCYVGSLYGGARDFTSFFREIKKLITAKQIHIDKIKVVYAGKEGHIFTSQAMPFGLSGIIDDKGFVTRQESMKLQYQSDICLVSSWNTDKDKGIMTGKVFEYFTYRKPIIAIINGDRPNSELSKVISEVNAGCCLEEGSNSYELDVMKLNRFILNAYNSLLKHGLIEHQYLEEVNNYSIEVITQKLVLLMKK